MERRSIAGLRRKALSMKAKGLPPHLYKSGGRWRRDNAIEEIKRLDALLEYAVQHNDAAEAERLREELRRLTGN